MKLINQYLKSLSLKFNQKDFDCFIIELFYNEIDIKNLQDVYNLAHYFHEANEGDFFSYKLYFKPFHPIKEQNLDGLIFKEETFIKLMNNQSMDFYINLLIEYEKSLKENVLTEISLWRNVFSVIDKNGDKSFKTKCNHDCDYSYKVYETKQIFFEEIRNIAFYPFILYPKAILKIKNNDFKFLFQQELTIPVEPILIKEIMHTAFSIILIILIYSFWSNVVLPIKLILIPLSLIYLYKSIKSIYAYDNLKHEYQKIVSENINIKKLNLMLLKTLDTASSTLEKQQIGFIKALEKHEYPFEADVSYKIGKSELVFFNHLKTIFGDQIKNNFSFDFYEPDFVFINDVIAIDIEVDEPYTNSEFSKNSIIPIHFIDEQKIDSFNNIKFSSDNKREKYFIDKNWVIIRFSEKQVVKSPISCCKIIANVIFELTGNDEFSSKLIGVEELGKEKRWTKLESMNMIANNYRRSY